MKTKKLKGSVLFTVIAVMMVVLVFVMSALTIAGATSRRAYSDYSKAQAKYTARAALDATMASLRDYTEDPSTHALKNNALGKHVAGLKLNEEVDLDVDFGGDEAVAEGGKASVNIKCIDDKYEYIDGKKHQIVAVTATVEFAGETSQETMIILKDPDFDDDDGGDSSKAVNSLSGLSSSTAGVILGGSGADLDKAMDGSGITIWNNAQARMTGSAIINSSLGLQNIHAVSLDKGERLSVFGDFMFANSGNNMFINNEDFITGSMTFMETPAIYIDGTAYFTKGYQYNPYYLEGATHEAAIGDGGGANIAIGTKNHGMNIFCKNMYLRKINEKDDKGNPMGIYADIYAFGEGETSYIGAGEYQNSTVLLEWAGNLISPAKIETRGSFITKGNVDVNLGFTMEGDLLVEGNLNCEYKEPSAITKSTSEIKGTLSVGKELNLKNGTLKCKKLVVNDINKVTIGSDATLIVSDVPYTSAKAISETYSEDGVEGSILSHEWEGDLGGDVNVNVEYPLNLTRNNLLGYEKDPDTGADVYMTDDLGNKVKSGDSKKWKIADLPAEGYGTYMDRKDDGTIYYEPNYFKTWENTKDKNNDDVIGMKEHFYKADGVTLKGPTVEEKNMMDLIESATTVNADGRLQATLNAGAGKYYVLTGGKLCKKTDTGTKGTLVINVPKGESAWIYLKDGLEIDADGKSGILVTGGGTLNIYLKEKGISLKGGFISTQYYQKFMRGEMKDAEGYSTVYETITKDEEMPNIYIYADYANKTNPPSIEMPSGNSYISGYIYAPNSKFESKSGGVKMNVEYHTTKGSTIKENGEIKVIGSVFVGEFNIENDAMFIHVRKGNAPKPPADDDAATVWATLGYTAGNGLE